MTNIALMLNLPAYMNQCTISELQSALRYIRNSEKRNEYNPAIRKDAIRQIENELNRRNAYIPRD
jgi:hypothetical protein